MEDRFFDVGRMRIRYVECGAGDPVMLLHGYAEDIESDWIETGILEALSKDHRVIALDLRAHGKSAKPHDPAKYGAEMARDILRLMDLLKIDRAHVVGHGLGGVLTVYLLATASGRITSAILIGASGRRSWDEETARLSRTEAQELEYEHSYRSMLTRTWPADEPPPTERQIAALSKALINHGSDPLAHAAMIRARERERVNEADLVATGVPTLAIFGAADPNLRRGRSLKDAWPALDLKVVDGATHRGPRGILRQPRTIDLTRAFINAHPTAR